MNLRVRYFAAFREAAGTGSEEIESGATCPSALFRECAQRHRNLQRYASSLVAVNGELAGWDTELRENDEILFFPPVAGG